MIFDKLRHCVVLPSTFH